MILSRRHFLRSLGIGTLAALSGGASKVIEVCTQQAIAHRPDLLTAYWFQSPRMVVHASPAYLAALERIFAGHDPDTFLRGFQSR